MVQWYIGTLQHQVSCLAIERLRGSILPAVTKFLDKVIALQSFDFHTSSTFARQVKAALNILRRKLFWQSAEGLVGLLPALHVH